tara:strand:- start:743 stop:889 length:147 start_codon:yes stop_codon:yes gene_type:complete
MIYGRTMKKAMAIFDINPRNWYELAADRKKWLAMIATDDSFGAVLEDN